MTWTPLTLATQAATQSLIEKTIGFSQAIYQNSAYMAQRAGSIADDRWTGAQRKALFFEAIGLGRWELMREVAHARLRAVEDELQRIAGKLEAAEAELAWKPGLERGRADLVRRESDGAKMLEASEGMLERSAATYAQAEKSRSELATAEAELRAAEEKYGRLHEIETDALLARQQLGPALELLETLPTPEKLDALVDAEREARETCDAHARAAEALDASKREAALAEARKAALVAQANGMREKAEKLRWLANDLGTKDTWEITSCSQCGAIHNAERRAADIATKRVEADKLAAAAADIDSQAEGVTAPEIVALPEGDPPTESLAEATEKLRQAREQAVQAGGLRERIGNLQQKIAQAEDESFLAEHAQAAALAHDAKAIADVLRAASPDQVELDRLGSEVTLARDQVAHDRADLDSVRHEKIRLDTELERLGQIEQEAAKDRTAREALLHRTDVLTWLERGCGRNGVPALILENKVTLIEHEADRIVQLLGRSYRFEIRTQKELKKKDAGLSDTLDVVIHVQTDGVTAPYSSFSGSEKVRIDWALRVGILRALGADIDILILDEPEGLDADARAEIPAMLEGLAGEFATILLVTQYEDLAEAFEQTIHLEGGGETGEPSRIVSEQAGELVAA